MPAADRSEGLVPLQIDRHRLAGLDVDALQDAAAAEILRRPCPDAAGEPCGDRIEGVLVEIAALVARRGEITDTLGGDVLDRLLDDAAVLVERLVEVRDVVD